MPNYFVFDQSNSSFYGQLTNNYTEPGMMSPTDMDAATNNREFIATASNSGTLGLLGGSVIITLQISNPSGSGRTMYISSITGGINVSLSLLSSFSGSITLYSGGTLTSPATVTPFSTKFGSGATSSMTAHSSTSAPTGATALLSYALTPGMFTLPFAGSLIVPPNQTFTMNVSSSLSVAGVMANTATVSWWEV
ncbi:hypothetical protein DFQ01_101227 [Paenibacillus cellulosilyticus]|uniref:Uncharacterized protein n=1 Tax=Paenibacillus cellulosilyticus TaxID=375489 RepID=A0A2V2Z0B2_9BACL|nr:hypothetical protein [Paenibacillus cellulosilyticus]PWW08504.1 hypothetical protein DFQ01_101227 [Paenibacillus cellulosilyticus]QKS48085.1 hypothetical protein HUB94_27765 [Paenibacillus cellulosilyticus]